MVLNIRFIVNDRLYMNMKVVIVIGVCIVFVSDVFR